MAIPFKGLINVDIRDSVPDWAPFEPPKSPEGAPSVLYIVLDDVGFSAIGCYGGPVETPNIDRIAASGVRYTQWHTTALCSPTRSCLLTGRNHTRNSMACITEAAIGFPNASGTIPPENGMLPEILGELGWNTYMTGKWHLCPTDEMHLASTRRNWPTGRGFERFYGFLGAETNQWHPDLVYDNHPVDQPTQPEDGYHLTVDLTDRALEFIQDAKAVAPEKPFCLYYAPGACHAPHHVPKEWIEKYRGRFDMGYEAMREQTLERQKKLGIVPADTQLPALNPIGTPQDRKGPNGEPFPAVDFTRPWASLSDDERRLFCRMAEVYAGFLAHADDQIGRLLAYLEQTEQLDNTMIVLVSDNGASGEGGPNGSVNENKLFNGMPDDIEQNLAMIDELGGPNAYNHYPNGWAMAFNTPFKLWKRYEFNGGSCDPCMISWPAGIKARGEVRHQYHHAIDIVPTILDCLGVEAPESIKGHVQSSFDGISMHYSFDEATIPTARSTQFYSMLGSRAIWHEGWKAITTHPTIAGWAHFNDDTWELYNVEADRAELHDLSAEHPDKLRELINLWFSEAGRNGAFPLDDRSPIEILNTPRPQLTSPRNRYRYFPAAAGVPEAQAVNIRNRDYIIGAVVDLPGPGASGVLFAQGSHFGGHALFVKDNRLHYIYNFVGVFEQNVAATKDLPVGENLIISAAFVKDGEDPPGVSTGILSLYHGDEKVGEGRIKTQPGQFGISGTDLTVGRGRSRITVSYPGTRPWPFTGGTIKTVAVDVSGEPYVDLEREAAAMIARE
ncbi:MAG TPA: arylsulfatase [Solirubrobacteraceae bacterium]|jgi:arylsulfatase